MGRKLGLSAKGRWLAINSSSLLPSGSSAFLFWKRTELPPIKLKMSAVCMCVWGGTRSPGECSPSLGPRPSSSPSINTDRTRTLQPVRSFLRHFGVELNRGLWLGHRRISGLLPRAPRTPGESQSDSVHL